jgi:hypothetical protein
METNAVSKFTSASKEIKSVSADITFEACSVNQQIRAHVLDTINGIKGAGGLKGRLRAAARALGLTFDRVRRYHYGEVKRIEAHEAFQIIRRREIAKREELARKRLEYEAARLEMANSAPSYLAFLVPPSLPDLEGAAEVAEDDPHG